jgi:UDP-N-acetylmuramoyl-tripeptide--D-alanyl-D-alanine ligase
MKWDLAMVAAAVGGEAFGSVEVTGVAIDSRRVAAGDLFVALAGNRADGHDYLADAVAAGAAGILVERGRRVPGVGAVEVDDTLEALRHLAVARRSELGMPVAAVTGSSGKTTTKDMLAVAVGPGAHAAPFSYNNEIGVPLTVLSTPEDASVLIVEVGSRGPGHIALLAPAVRPDVAVITHVGRAHLETFGSVESVLESKWELVEALPPEGIAVLPREDERLLQRRSGAPTLTFGEVPDADVAIATLCVDRCGRPSFQLRCRGETVEVSLRAAGRHQARNAAAAVAGALALGTEFASAAERVGEASVSPWRMEVIEGAVTVINDSYNANPDSMEAALRTVAALDGRSFAVLGKMHELGEFEEAAHRQVGELARRLGFTSVIVVGADPGIAAGAGPIGRRVASAGEAQALIRDLLGEGDVVLVKASRAEGLEGLAEAIARGAA